MTLDKLLPINPLPALLAWNDPALAYFVRCDLLEEMVAPVETLWELPEAARLVSKQQADGSWRYPGKSYDPRTGTNYDLLETYRQLRVLVETYGFQSTHPIVRQAAHFVFSCQTLEGDIRGILSNQTMPYYHGAILELLIKAGYAGDPRVELLSFDATTAPTNTPQEFLAFCGVIGLGRLVADGRRDLLPSLRHHSNDPRWRMREGVAMALQRQGRVDMPGLLTEMDAWSRGSLLEQRAAAAALCEPALLRDSADAKRTLQILDAITQSVEQYEDRRSDAFQALRKGLAYCWSVAVAALPETGKPMMEHWLTCEDRDVRWIMRQNLQKQRLVRADPNRVATCTGTLISKENS